MRLTEKISVCDLTAVMKLLVSLCSLWKRCEGDEETEEEQRKDDSLLKESTMRDE